MKLAQRKQQRMSEMAHKEFRAIEFDFRRRVVDDIEEMLDGARAFEVEIYVVDEDGTSTGGMVDDDADSREKDKLRRLAEQIADYVIGEK